MKSILTIVLLATAFLTSVPSTTRAAETSPPNILFGIADDWGFGHASAYGAKWVKTPAFDQVARAGLLFTHAYTPNAKCAPSRACILTGRNSWQLKDAANHLCFFPVEFKGWPEALSEKGWHVGHTSKGWGPGVAIGEDGQPRLMTGTAYNRNTAKPPTSGIGRSDYAANFDDFLTAAPSGKPWCFWYGAVEPHRGYEFGSGIKKGGKQLEDIDHVPAYWPDNETVRNDILDYAYEIEHFDNHLGRMLGSLDKRGLLASTLVIVTSDHGMPFPRCKGNAYEASNHVPLAVMWKQGIVSPGRKIDDYISFVDLAPTIIDAAGYDWKDVGLANSPGQSMNDIFQSEKSGQVNPTRDHVLIGMERHDVGRPNDGGYPIRGIIANEKLYLHNFEIDRWPAGNPETGYLNCDGGPTKTHILAARRATGTDPFWDLCFGKRPTDELFDLASDRDCVVNLALDNPSTQELTAMRKRLFGKLREQADPRMFGNGKVFDEYEHSNPANRGFYERYLAGEKVKAGWVSETDFESAPLD